MAQASVDQAELVVGADREAKVAVAVASVAEAEAAASNP